jgi:hypothetical protein
VAGLSSAGDCSQASCFDLKAGTFYHAFRAVILTLILRRGESEGH